MWQDQAYPQDSDPLGKDTGNPRIFQTDNKPLEMSILKKKVLIEEQNNTLFNKQSKTQIQSGCWVANVVP